jgi:hypothetical protein
VDLQRLRRQVAFDRLLARLHQEAPNRWILKGGYAMELRMREARATKDIDLAFADPRSVIQSDSGIGERLREELLDDLSKDPGDFFTFLVAESSLDIDAAPYGGARYPIDARLDGRTFVKFHVDIGVGDVVVLPLESTTTGDWLGFAGIYASKVVMLSSEQQFFEKLHAYTLPDRPVPNSRVKDLVDMVLLVTKANMDSTRVKHCLVSTFERRKTHRLPESLSPPPGNWKPVFEPLAATCGLDTDMDNAFAVLDEYCSKL